MERRAQLGMKHPLTHSTASLVQPSAAGRLRHFHSPFAPNTQTNKLTEKVIPNLALSTGGLLGNTDSLTYLRRAQCHLYGFSSLVFAPISYSFHL